MDNIERSENCYPTKYVVNLGIFGPVIQCSIVDKGLFTWPNTIDGTILSFRSSRDNIDQISIRIKTHHLLVCLNFVSLIPFSRQIEFPRWMDSTEETISSFRPFDNNNFRNTVFEKEKTRGEEDRGKIRRSSRNRWCSSRNRPPSEYTHLFHRYPHCSNKRFSKSSCSKLFLYETLLSFQCRPFVKRSIPSIHFTRRIDHFAQVPFKKISD